MPDSKKTLSSKSKWLIAAGSLALASAIIIGVVFGVKSAQNKNAPGTNIVKPINYTIKMENRYSLDVIGVDISSTDLLNKRDIGKLINNKTDMNNFVTTYDVDVSSSLYENMSLFDDSFFNSCSIVVMLCYEKENIQLSLLSLNDHISGLNDGDSMYNSNLLSVIGIEDFESNQPHIYSAIVEITKSSLSNLEYKLTSQDLIYMYAKNSGE